MIASARSACETPRSPTGAPYGCWLSPALRSSSPSGVARRTLGASIRSTQRRLRGYFLRVHCQGTTRRRKWRRVPAQPAVPAFSEPAFELSSHHLDLLHFVEIKRDLLARCRMNGLHRFTRTFRPQPLWNDDVLRSPAKHRYPFSAS